MSLRNLDALGAVSLRQRRGRSVLTGLGIAFGVAVLFGVLVANGSVRVGIQHEIDRFTGRSDVAAQAVGDFGGTIPAAQVTAVGALPDVRLVSARGVVPATVSGVTARVAGIDPAYRQIGDLSVKQGRLPADDADEVALDLDVELPDVGLPPMDSTLVFTTGTGDHPVKVVGYLDATTARHVGFGVSALTSLATAERIAGAPVVDLLQIDLNPGVKTQPWIEAHQHDVPGVSFDDASKLNAGFDSFIAVITSSLTLFAVLALFVGGFLIYLTLSVSVVERTPTYGTLRALGATPRQVLRVVVAEAATLGAVATVAGLVLGTLIGLGLVAVLGGLFGLKSPAFTVSPSGFIAAVVLGMGTSVAAAVLPARRAAALSPVTAMRGNVAASTKNSQAWIVGAVLAPAGVALGFGSSGTGATGLAVLLMLAGGVLLVPPLLPPMASVVGRATGRLARGVGAVTVMHLVKERARSAYTLALVMVVLAVGLAIGIGRTSMNAALDQTLRKQYGADVDVFSPGVLTPGQLAAVQAVPGVGVVSGLAFGHTNLVADSGAERSVGIQFVDGATYFQVQGFAWADGDERSAEAALTAGGSVLMPATTADKLGLKRGTTVRVETRAGTRAFAVAGTFDQFGGNGDEIVVGFADAAALFGTAGPSGLVVKAAAGTKPAELAARIRKATQAGDALTFRSLTLNVVDGAANRAGAHARLDGFLRLFEAVALVAVFVGLLGLANTLAMSVVQRFREIGLLRAVGAEARQVRQMVVVESATLASVAALLAIPLGLLLSYLMLRSASAGLGYTVPWKVSVLDIPFLLVLTMAVAGLAALAPARRAGRLTIVETLRND